MCSTFSILERIDDVVTLAETVRRVMAADFQYPRTDRRCCDEALSTSDFPYLFAFSILERIDDVVTRGGRLGD